MLKNYRYLVDFDSNEIQKEYHDVVIIGSGIAGVYTALEIPSKYDVAILTKETLDISNSVLAQGGIAVSLDKNDSPELHLKDTLYAGAGLCDEETVWVLVNEAAGNIERLCDFGVNFDRKNTDELSLTREGAHSMNRIIHAGDTTGKEVCDKLISVVKTRSNININERTFVLDMITGDDTCKGVLVYDEDTKRYKIFVSNIVICATGGYGQLFSYTTNPEVATGDGVCMAYRAGCELMDLEFVQFHPTVLFHPENKSFLISEAVRGEGALLKTRDGRRFMPDYHPMKELAPRDVVSRAIFEEMRKTKTDHVYLDITFKGREYLENRFPNIYKTCLGYGIDISKDMIPVAPAEHYCMGGIRADVYGRTRIKGFFTCGESACNGIHGANRLASNSLLEGLVFGRKIGVQVDDILKDHCNDHGEDQKACSSFHTGKEKAESEIVVNYKTGRQDMIPNSAEIKADIQDIMQEHVGIVRNKQGLTKALEKIMKYTNMYGNKSNAKMVDCEVQNMLLLSRLVIEAALEREESRGAHYRSDFSSTDDEHWKRHIIKTVEEVN